MSIFLKQINGVDVIDWTRAISLRIADEWCSDFEEDKVVLRGALEHALINTPASIKVLIGTRVIEKDYFEKID